MNKNTYMVYHIAPFEESYRDNVIGVGTSIIDAVNICRKKASEDNIELTKKVVISLISNFRSKYTSDESEFIIVPYILNTVI